MSLPFSIKGLQQANECWPEYAYILQYLKINASSHVYITYLELLPQLVVLECHYLYSCKFHNDLSFDNHSSPWW
ncbi:hypothetical protein NQ317_000824 [Molorchus minor]|uniref:Uncharacterized protein n=1 Tax=Molorchus minor TaxID=1323400 RepID=A0ABQ9J8D3_9CUCU|nr:hypothetical protein NQ317_000824 [Molorchus minor]